MKVIEPSFSLHTPFGPLTEEKGLQLLRFIEANARISHRAEGGQKDDSWQRFIQAHVMDHADWSVAEHGSITANVRTDRGVMFELTRHRLFSFTVESTRFVNHKKKGGDLEFIKPLELSEAGEPVWLESMHRAEMAYLRLLELGERPQEARSVLPNTFATSLSITGNIRNWRLFFMSRVTNESHPDMRRITVPMLAEFKKYIPILFDDIEPEIKQSISLARAR